MTALIKGYSKAPINTTPSQQVDQSPETPPSGYRLTGTVYTPHSLAAYVAEKLYGYLTQSSLIGNKQRLSILDPACGDGALLRAIDGAVANQRDLQLLGVDLNKHAISVARKRMGDSANFVTTNGLCPFNQVRKVGWRRLLKRFGAEQGVDCIIANPPWGAQIDGYKSLVDASAFSLNRGQFDTSDLFIEASLEILSDGGFIAFIVPDSLFFQERERLRRLLLEETSIRFIGRFGEKIFKDINRACAVVICEKKPNFVDDFVDCLRLNPESKKQILSGGMSFHDAEAALGRKIKQSRFLSNPGHEFNIDLDDAQIKTFKKIAQSPSSLAAHLHSSRGVELSKKGKVIQCQQCLKWCPLPRKRTLNCSQCKNESSISNLPQRTIIHTTNVAKSKRLIVGEDIQRFSADSRSWLEIDAAGINYKEFSLYEGDKIVVRKTGVGLTCAVDYLGCFTNQVVYVLKLKSNASNLPLEFFQAVLSSRAIFFYISMLSGENEWRSHPYLTQRQILEIPLPNMNDLTDSLLDEISDICARLREVLSGKGGVDCELDAQVERVVADLYDLREEDYRSIFSVLENSQELVPVKALKRISLSDIF